MMTQEEFFKRYSYTPSKDRIGGGGFGTVYKAKDNLLHRIVAIKVSEVKTTADGQKTFSLKDEFEALDHVPKHPNIANYEEFYSFEMPNGIFDYAVMQYYPDGNLSNAIKQGLTDAQKDDIASQLLEGIAFLHQHKVVHRDLKPGNILVVRDGDKVIPLITDFGLSKAASTGDGSVFTNSFGGGTPRYSSPEQLQGQPLRFNTDLWSFGAILYEVFTGQQLFSPGSGASNTAQADLEIFNKIVHGDVQSLGKMPEKWRKVAERCLVVDPGKRAKSAEELRALLCEDEEETEVTMGAAGGAASGNPKVKAPEPVKGQKQSSSPKAERPSASPKTEKPTSSPKAERPVSAPAKEAAMEGGKSKKGLWIALGAVAAAVLLAVLLLRPKDKPLEESLDTQAYRACQTAQDYRRYMNEYGTKSEHYADAKKFVNDYLADSTAKAQQQNQQTSSTTASSNGAFSVSSGKKVFFAKGNLQYNPSSNSWRIASNPWDVIGEANKNISPNYSGWIDLFGWGTGNDPTKASTDDADYSSFTDWGSKYKSGWYTLTKDEWVYVFNKRSTPSGIRYAKAKVNGMNGVVLLPDDWNKSTYGLSNTNNSDASFSSNSISLSIWNSTFSPAGAVFLPAAGWRNGTTVYDVGSYGDYWSSSPSGSDGAYIVSFDDSSLYPGNWSSLNGGQGVRLVRPAEN